MASNSSIEKLQELMAERKVDLVVLWPSANWLYLVSFAPIATERPAFLMVSPDKICAVVPDFDRAEVIEKTGLDQVFPWNDAAGPKEAVAEAWGRMAGTGAEDVVLDDTMPFEFIKALEPHLGTRSQDLASQLMTELRGIKTAEEIAAIRKTSELIERTIARLGGVLKAGMTERELETRLRIALMEEGAETLDYVLVQAVPHSASPHHRADSTVIHAGEPVLMDIGVSMGGYFSDITRNACLGEPSDEYKNVFGIVRAAQANAVETVKPGVTAGAIDAAARDVIQESGMGKFFSTRTGHGLGLDIHEPPSVAPGNPKVLEEGMVFTVEPGIYIPAKFGVRVEDTVAVTDGGVERLTVSNRDLIVL